MEKKFLEAMVDLFYCPNSGKIIEGIKGDDKVVCGCGKQNPNCLQRESGIGTIHHVKRFLRAASVEDYIKQEENKRKQQQ